jgi:hypothetical protein
VTSRRLRFFLGGRDLEMATIADLVTRTLSAEAVVDAGAGWGAAASLYRDAIAQAARSGVTPALVELVRDIDLPQGAIEIDHHGARASEPTALEQAFALLGLPASAWTREFALVAANDRAHVAGLRALGATPAEIARIRAADRAAQGITPAEERAGAAALARARRLHDGALLFVEAPHDRLATIVDPLAEANATPPHLLVAGPGEIAYSGGWVAAAALDAALPGGWRGGDPPATGFWGRRRAPGDVETALARLDALAASRASGPTPRSENSP